MRIVQEKLTGYSEFRNAMGVLPKLSREKLTLINKMAVNF